MPMKISKSRTIIATAIATALVAAIAWANVPNGPQPNVGLTWYTSSDPTTGAGVAAPLAQLLIRQDTPSIYYKSGPLPTNWTEAGVGGGGGGGGTVTDVTGTNGVQVTSGTTTPLVQLAPCGSTNKIYETLDGTTWTCVAFPSGGGNVSGTGTANQTVKWTGGSTVGNAWATDDGTTWGVASIFTITEASGNTKAFGTLESAGILTADTSISLPTAGTSTFAAFANGSGAAASATATGRLIYDNTNHTFDVSTNAGGYVAILTGTPGAVGITGTVASNNIPRGASTSSLQTGSFTDTGTAISASSTLTMTGVLSANDSLALASGTAANNFESFSNGSGAAASAANTGRIIYDATSQTFMTSTNAGAYTSIGTGTVTGTGTANRTTKWTGTGAIGNAFFSDDGTTWGSASIFTITEASGNTKAFGTLESAGVFTADTSISLPTAGTSTFAAFANGSGAAASATATGRIIYDNTNATFDVSMNGGAYVSLLSGPLGAAGITGTVASNNIPRGAGTTSLQTGSFTDTGTAISASSTLTMTGVLSANDSLALASGTAANNFESFSNGSGAAASAANTGRIIYDATSQTFMTSTNAGAYTSIGTGTVTGTGTANRTTKWTGTGAIGNAFFADDGTTWGSASIFTITEATGATSINGLLTIASGESLTPAGTSTSSRSRTDPAPRYRQRRRAGSSTSQRRRCSA